MSDFNSSLPIRTQNNGDVVAQLVDGTVTTQKLAINASGQLALTVQGSATGGTASSLSNLAGGIFNTSLPTLTTGQQASLQLDSSGRLIVNIGTSSGSISVTQGTSPWVTSDLADGSVAAGTAGTKSMLAGLVFNTALPTLTNGQQVALQGDSSGRLLIGALSTGANVIGAVTQSGGPWTQNLTQVGGSAIALGQTTMSASLPVAIASNQSTLNVKDTSDGPVTPGTVAANSILIGGQFNTALPTLTNGQQAAIQVDSSGRLFVDGSGVTQPVSGTITANQGTANTAANAWSVTLATGGVANGPTNPIFVSSSDTVGTSIDNYNTAAAIASAATSNHDYTVTTAKTFYSKQFWAAASGKLKIEVQYETGAATGVFNSFWVGFNSTANPEILIPVPTSKTQVAGARIRIIRTNLDLSSQDVYSTTSGTEQ